MKNRYKNDKKITLNEFYIHTLKVRPEIISKFMKNCLLQLGFETDTKLDLTSCLENSVPLKTFAF